MSRKFVVAHNADLCSRVLSLLISWLVRALRAPERVERDGKIGLCPRKRSVFIGHEASVSQVVEFWTGPTIRDLSYGTV